MRGTTQYGEGLGLRKKKRIEKNGERTRGRGGQGYRIPLGREKSKVFGTKNKKIKPKEENTRKRYEKKLNQ